MQNKLLQKKCNFHPQILGSLINKATGIYNYNTFVMLAIMISFFYHKWPMNWCFNFENPSRIGYILHIIHNLWNEIVRNYAL